jgi:predicted O-methyltransferase YrrM
MTRADDRASRVRKRIDEMYAQGVAIDEAGAEVTLYPHSVAPAQARALRDLAVAERAENTLEIGFAMGLSSLALCEALLESGVDAPRHTVIDPAQHHWRNTGLRSLSDAGVSDLVEFIPEESQLALPRLAAEGRRFDLAFIDGDHRFESVFLDLYYCLRLVKPSGLIVLDDVWMPSVALAASYFERQRGLTLEGGPPLLRERLRRRRWQSGELAALRTPEAPVAAPEQAAPFGRPR